MIFYKVAAHSVALNIDRWSDQEDQFYLAEGEEATSVLSAFHIQKPDYKVFGIKHWNEFNEVKDQRFYVIARRFSYRFV